MRICCIWCLEKGNTYKICRPNVSLNALNFTEFAEK